MRRFFPLLQRFRSDERGAFLALFGLMAVVLVATSGAVVDFVSVEQARTRAQVALDSAALALQPTIHNANAAVTIKTSAEKLLIERLGDSSIVASIDSVAIDTSEGTLELKARLVVKMSFVALLGINTITATLISVASRKKLNLEVAFVLDNSGSMGQHDRIEELREATTCAVNVLLNGECNSAATTTTTTNVSIGIVPFTLHVNVGTSNKTASWLDRTGTVGTHVARDSIRSNNITNDNFDRDDYDGSVFNGTVDRIALMDQMANADWGGCVEARKPPYDTNDALPVSGTDTMFTPMFAPDEPDSGGFNNNYLDDEPASCLNRAPTWVWTQTKYSCNQVANNQSSYDGATCNGASPTNTYVQTSHLGVVTVGSSTAPATLFNNTPTITNSYATISGTGSNRTNRRIRTYTYNFSPRELQERICKYTGATASNVSQSGGRGPNADCPVNPITPLTSTKATIMDAIDDLDDQGGTNIHAGTEWGFRVLSPTQPFTQGAAYGPNTSKVMIIMTDGENTAYDDDNMNNTTMYSQYGYPWNTRLGTATSTEAQHETQMNTRMTTTCTNIKAAGIVIYTIGLSVDDTSAPATNTQMLKDCSSGTGYWFFPDDDDDLSAVFLEIADQLSALRLAK